ncbi:hypothetical protein GCM10009623_36570 [Nocardioides aestuarii]
MSSTSKAARQVALFSALAAVFFVVIFIVADDGTMRVFTAIGLVLALGGLILAGAASRKAARQGPESPPQ